MTRKEKQKKQTTEPEKKPAKAEKKGLMGWISGHKTAFIFIIIVILLAVLYFLFGKKYLAKMMSGAANATDALEAGIPSDIDLAQMNS